MCSDRADMEVSRNSAGPRRSDAAHMAILDAAEALLREGGVSAVNFEAVARRARAGKPTLYRWWPNKFALLLEVYEREKWRHIHDVDEGSLRADLMEQTRQLWSYWRDTPAGGAFAGMITSAQASEEARKALVDHFADDERSPLTPILKRAVARGELDRALDLRVSRDLIMAQNWYHLLTARLQDAEIGQMVDLLLLGLCGKRA